MQHPDWPAFIAAIIANPDEDTPRLVAADFLEENGETDRAAFIRIQCAIARLEASGLQKSLEMDELRKKERAYLGPLSVSRLLWAAEACPELVRMPPQGRTSSPLDRLHVDGAERLTWRRGFVEAVSCPTAEWIRHGVAVRKRQPVVSVTLIDFGELSRDAVYAVVPALKGLREVVLGNVSAAVGEWLQQWLPGTRVSLATTLQLPPVPPEAQS